MKFYYVKTEDTYAKGYYVQQDSKKYKCEQCGKVYQVERIADYRVLFRGKKLGDFYRAPGCYIGNEIFCNALKKHGITGYRIRNIDCVGWYDSWNDNRDNILDVDTGNLREIEIIGKCGYMHDMLGNEITECEVCGSISYKFSKNIHGLTVPLDTWDGTDIFSFKNWQGVMVCTERLKEACEKEKIRNIIFQPLEEFSFS